jgi:heme A synthase
MKRFRNAAWATLALTVAVIAGGAVVRATGSGAGCGSDWPSCRGGVVPFSGSTETLIEFTHRATSGLAFLAVVGLVLWARRLYPEGHRVRRAAWMSTIFIVGEVLIGAALVTYEWVGDDASVMRAVVDGLHLINTLFLVGALALTAWWASGRDPFRIEGPEARLLLIGLVAVVVVAAAGAVTALGDTLFPDAGVAEDLSYESHFLVRMRVVHPVVAAITGAYLLFVARAFSHDRRPVVGPLATALGAVVIVQLMAGVVNLALGAPLWLQVVHLLLSNTLWITLVLLTAATTATRSALVGSAQ